MHECPGTHCSCEDHSFYGEEVPQLREALRSLTEKAKADDEQITALWDHPTDGVKALRTLVEKQRKALRPFARFAEQWRRKPISGLDDQMYAIHVGTEYEASLRRSDCEEARAVLAAEVPRE